MAAPKRTTIQIERDRRDIADLYLQGWTQERIKGYVNERRPYDISRQMVSYDLQRIKEAWLKSTLIDFNEAKARELAEIDRLEREYWDAWEQSKQLETERVTGRRDKPSQYARTVKTQPGDPRFLSGVQWCIDRRCKILGVDAPVRTDVTSKGEKVKAVQIDLGSLTDDQLDALASLRQSLVADRSGDSEP